jgi:hypothetical protein
VEPQHLLGLFTFQNNLISTAIIKTAKPSVYSVLSEAPQATALPLWRATFCGRVVGDRKRKI